MKKQFNLTAFAETSWHVASTDMLFKCLHTSPEGLSFLEARRRKKIFGANRLVQVHPKNYWIRFFRQFHNVFIYLLLISAVIVGVLGHFTDMSVIFSVVLVNAIISFIQEDKAEKALSSVRALLTPRATVVRKGHRKVIHASSVVVGDIVVLQRGDRVPADLRLFYVKNLEVQEAILTGESHAVKKSIEPVDEKSALGDRYSMAYSGTVVTYGQAEGIVIAVGQQTEVGKITDLVSHIPSTTTPLLKQFNRFGYFLSTAILLIATVTFLVGALVWHDSSVDMFLGVVGLTVAAIPEGLPAILTIILAIGVTRMAKRHAIVRSLPCVETMGSVSVICADKTGTLTRNELSVQTIITAEANYHVVGGGYNDEGELHLNQAIFPLEEHPDLREVIRAGILCNDAELVEEDGHWQLRGNPTDGALLALGLKAKIDLAREKQDYPNTDLIPFESEHKWMATLHHDHEGQGYIFVKGAPEILLKRCRFERVQGHDQSLQTDHWLEKLQTLTKAGQRVIAVAMKKTQAAHRDLVFHDVDSELTLLGLLGISDPPREEAIVAVRECQSAGIEVKMITGDHAETASVIAKQLGINNADKVLLGHELEQMTDVELQAIVDEVNIYARTSPTHKLRLVQALQAKGRIVAMTGDGVNDAPALKQADIGVAMGIRGTDAAKEISQMVLTDDNFVSIYHAVKEGRTVYDNIKKAILYSLPTNLGETCMMMLAILFGYVLPMTAVQILWVNMITEVTLAISLSFESAEAGIMKRLPRSSHEPILSRFLVWRLAYVTLLMVLCGFGLFIYERHTGASLAAARTVVVNMVVMSEIVYLLNCRKTYDSGFSLDNLFGSKPVLIAIGVTLFFQWAFTYVPMMQYFFGSASIDIFQWTRILLLSSIIFLLVEIEKWIVRRRLRVES